MSAPAFPFASPTQSADVVQFIEAMRFVHRNGEKTARHALAAGMKPADLWMVMLGGVSDAQDPDTWPRLMFNGEGGKGSRSFGPHGEML
ncbi:hypothetical protein [Caulobacter sp. DWP3-1-3b2]|uniref:hypothetical protein n=1 Tax=Caulobacter sp. DWP3-1-3b2 TaxID=2804643 RepID=UPI003CEB0C93